MNRKDFFKSLIGIALAPLAIRQIAKEESHCMVITRDGNNTMIYKDGEKIASKGLYDALALQKDFEIAERMNYSYFWKPKLINWKISDMNNFYDKNGNLI